MIVHCMRFGWTTMGLPSEYLNLFVLTKIDTISNYACTVCAETHEKGKNCNLPRSPHAGAVGLSSTRGRAIERLCTEKTPEYRSRVSVNSLLQIGSKSTSMSP